MNAGKRESTHTEERAFVIIFGAFEELSPFVAMLVGPRREQLSLLSGRARAVYFSLEGMGVQRHPDLWLSGARHERYVQLKVMDSHGFHTGAVTSAPSRQRPSHQTSIRTLRSSDGLAVSTYP